MFEEFEMVGLKKNRQAFSDSDSDDGRVPNTLLVRLDPARESLNQALA